MAKRKVIRADCKKCARRQIVSDHPDTGDPAAFDIRPRPRIRGYCPKCGSKMARFLDEKKPQDRRLLIAYRQLSPPGSEKKRPQRVVIQRTNGAVNTSAPERPPRRKEKRKMPKAMPKAKKEPESKQVKATFPLKIFADYGAKGEAKKRYRATMKGMDLFLYSKSKYPSPTAAAIAVTGGKRVNGWEFWKFEQDGETISISALRDPSEVSKRGATSTNKLPPYSDLTVPLPREDLPARNTRVSCAAYFQEPKRVKAGQVNVYIWIPGDELVHVRYTKTGVVSKGSVKKLGEYETWKEAVPVIAKDAAERGLVRVRIEA